MRSAWLPGFALLLAIVHEQSLAVRPTSLPKNEEELKGKVYSWLLSHDPLAMIDLRVLMASVVLLSQAQNIESAKRLLGLQRKLPEQPSATRETNSPSVLLDGSRSTTLINVQTKGDVVVSLVFHNQLKADYDP